MGADTALLTLSAVLVAVLFLVPERRSRLDDPVTTGDEAARGRPGAIAVIPDMPSWDGPVLRSSTGRSGSARTLGDLSRERLAVNVFDTRELLPFGNIALALALAPAGIVVILLLGLGQPGTLLSWTVILLATLASVLALLLPLRGVHQQMARAKQDVIGDIDRRLSEIYAELSGAAFGSARMVPLNQATNTLVPLRTTVSQLTTWPFRNTVAFGRAVLIASAPLVYAALSELIRVFWITPMGR